MGPVTHIVLALVLALGIAAIALPSRRSIRLSAIAALTSVAVFFTVMRPTVRATLAHHERAGGSWSPDWLAGVMSYKALLGHVPAVVLCAAVLLALIALRSGK